MSDVAAEMAALREELAQIRTAMEQQRRLQVPREPTDVTPSRLAEAINEILGYLRQANDIPVPDGQAEEGLDEFGESMRRALDKCEALAAADRGAKPGQPAEKVGEELKRQDPVIKFGQVVEAYDADGAVWTQPATLHTSHVGSFAKYAKTHPCSRAWVGNPGVPLWLDTSKDVYVGFPDIHITADPRLPARHWLTGSLRDEQGTGVNYCPAGLVIAYFEYTDAQDDPAQPFKIGGIEAGWIRSLAYLLVRGDYGAIGAPTGGGFEAQWGDELPVVTVLHKNETDEESMNVCGREKMTIDPCGRIVILTPETVLQSLKGHVDVNGQPIAIHWDNPA